jgi:glycine/serine hydroxymethyltransferase
MDSAEMDSISALIDAVLKPVRVTASGEYEINESLRNEIRDKVRQLCSKFPMR